MLQGMGLHPCSYGQHQLDSGGYYLKKKIQEVGKEYEEAGSRRSRRGGMIKIHCMHYIPQILREYVNFKNIFCTLFGNQLFTYVGLFLNYPVLLKYLPTPLSLCHLKWFIFNYMYIEGVCVHVCGYNATA